MIQPILNSKKIKYVVLNQLIGSKIDPNVDKINIFIDLASMLTKIYNPKILEEIKNINSSENRVLLSSGIANIVAHYRHYFWSRHGLSTNFYIYYSDEKASRCLFFNPEYRREFYSKRIEFNENFSVIQKMVSNNYNICEILFRYIINAHFINTKDLEPALLPYYILSSQKNNNRLNFILTNDKVQYQYVKFNNTYVLDVNSDNSKLIDKYNLYKEAGFEGLSHLQPEVYPIVLSMVKNKKYSLDGISGIGPKKVIGLINKAFDKNIIINTNYKDISIELAEMINEGIIKEENKEIILKNFQCYNYDLLYSYMTIKQKENIKKQVFNIYNNKKIMEINDRFYHNEPIMLLELSEGVVTNV